MRAIDQKPKLPDEFLSIDDWQDDKPMTGSWYNNPFAGILGIIASVAFLFCLTSFLPKGAPPPIQIGEHDEITADFEGARPPVLDGASPGSERRAASPQSPRPGDLNRALAGLDGNSRWESLQYLTNKANFDPSKKQGVQDRIIKILRTEPWELQNDLKVFSVWFDTEDSHRISALLKGASGHPNARTLVGAMSHLPNSVPALIAELAEHKPHTEVHRALSQEFANHDVQSAEISRELASKLQPTSSPEQFERITLLLNTMSWKTRSDPELKKRLAGAMAEAGRKLTSQQLQQMDKNIPDAIITFAILPESADLLQKLAATSDGARDVMSFLGRSRSGEGADDLALRLARENKVHPRQLLGYNESEAILQFLWEGQLKADSDFVGLRISRNDASMRAFSKAGAELIDSDPKSAIDSLWSIVYRFGRDMTRERMSGQFLEKLDTLLASSLVEDLRLPASAAKPNKRKFPKRRKMPASLKLAERLGGRKSALAIQKASKKKPHVLQEFRGILDALIALNQPDTYDMIVNAWVFHGDGKLETIGKAIEPTFIRRLSRRVKGPNAARSDHRSAIKNMMGALGRIGTSESIPVLKQQTKSKVVDFRKASEKALEMIRKRSGRN